ncbi:uncharacterized protein [Anabrus simplex]|uniref:uncharacterized protein n=1 Tax=Anabrus simplex TaxID=316456 RepID=UPI0034DD917E
MAEEVEKLIEKVREYVFLYDIGHPDYKNVARKAEAWREISEELGQTSETLKQKWKNLRDSYIKYKRFRNGLRGHVTKKQLKSTKKYQNWPWSQHLMFLDNPHAPRPMTSNFLETPLEETITSPSSPYPKSSCPQSPEQFEIPPPSTTKLKKNQKMEEVDRVIEYLENKNKNKYQLGRTQSPEQFEVPPLSTRILKKNQSMVEVDRVIEYLENKNKNKYQLGPTQSPEQAEMPPSSTKILKKNQPMEEVDRVIEYLENKNKSKYQLDGTDHLFISYAKTFKKLPPRTQAMLKIELATLFARAEVSALDAQTTPTSSPQYSANSVGSDLNSDESKAATEHYAADVLRRSNKDCAE